jgi:hypothetical protein
MFWNGVWILHCWRVPRACASWHGRRWPPNTNQFRPDWAHSVFSLSSSLHPSRSRLLVPACRTTRKGSACCGGHIGTQRVQGCGDCKSVASTFRLGIEQGMLARGRRIMGTSAHLDRSARSVGDARLSWKSHVTVSRSRGGVRVYRVLVLQSVIVRTRGNMRFVNDSTPGLSTCATVPAQ